MKLLLLSTLALFVGPLLSRVLSWAAFALSAIDGFVLVLVFGIVLGVILPHACDVAGWPVFPLAVAGYFAVRQIERLHKVGGAAAHRVAVALGLVGFASHEFLDGVALAMGRSDHGGEALLPLAIVLHRIPIGLSVFWLMRHAGRGAAALLFVALSTVLGFALSQQVFAHADSAVVGVFQSLVAGALLHAVVHEEQLRKGSHATWEAVGGLCGLLLLFLQHSQLLPSGRGGEAGMVQTFWLLCTESAPALLVAYLSAGLIGAFLPSAGIAWLGRGGSVVQAFRGVLFGLPLPICSCGVLPVYRSLIVRGVPPTAALAFLVAAPELGVDAVLLSFPLLGVPLTVARIGCAFLVAVVAAVVVSRFLPQTAVHNENTMSASPVQAPSGKRFQQVYRIGFVETVDHTAPWILLGLCIAAALEPLLRADWLAQLPKGLDVLLFALAGLPTYVCASSATPLVAVLLHKGISPGAAVAFLLTGPATNATTYGVLSQLHGRRVAVLYGAVIALLTIGLGLLLNQVLPTTGGYPLHEQAQHRHGLVQPLCAVALLMLFAVSFLRQGPRGFLRELATSLSVRGFSNGHLHEHGHEHGHGHDQADHGPGCNHKHSPNAQ